MTRPINTRELEPIEQAALESLEALQNESQRFEQTHVHLSQAGDAWTVTVIVTDSQTLDNTAYQASGHFVHDALRTALLKAGWVF